MRYVIRAVKYFVQVSLTMAIILLILMAAGLISTDINVAFQNGWRSVGIIANNSASGASRRAFSASGKTE